MLVRGGFRMEGDKERKNGDNYNSIINKIYLKKDYIFDAKF